MPTMRDIITLLETVQQPNISDVIRQEVQQYAERGMSPIQINSGDCDGFALDVISQLGRPTNLLDVETNNFTKRDRYGEIKCFDWKLIHDRWGIAVEASKRPLHDYIAQAYAQHVWIADQVSRKHYDAECPEGVSNFFDLPFFKRWISTATTARPMA